MSQAGTHNPESTTPTPQPVTAANASERREMPSPQGNVQAETAAGSASEMLLCFVLFLIGGDTPPSTQR